MLNKDGILACPSMSQFCLVLFIVINVYLVVVSEH